MNQLLAQIFELPARQRVLLLVGAVGLLFLVYAWWFYWPRADEIASKETQLEEMTKERNRKAALAANLVVARKTVADLNAALKQAVQQLPDTKEIPDLLSNISSVGREAGLEIMQFRQKEEQPIDFYAEVPVEIAVKGGYRQIASFFDQVSRLTRIVNMSSIVMKTPAKIERDQVILDTFCTATTFRFLDEAERERIAKEREKKAK
ncbi:MAG: type 4a pilus biogenesis protein PilO [Deltaproteobacteria bacterium]|nr:type 4a pilus biogenesis protein PilO [Deltaproteobacteria bacterium]MBI3389809.1 type 4a pilus biogenesis protein PilO [Deltaproteobacteria bacterium]